MGLSTNEQTNKHLCSRYKTDTQCKWQAFKIFHRAGIEASALNDPQTFAFHLNDLAEDRNSKGEKMKEKTFSFVVWGTHTVMSCTTLPPRVQQVL